MKKKFILILFVCILLIFLFTLISCNHENSSDGGDNTYTIGISLMNRQQSFYNDLEDGFREAAEKSGVKLDIKNAEQDATKQLDGVEIMIISDIDALILCPVDSDSAGSCVYAASKKDIPVFTVDIGSSSTGVVSHIASDNVAGGGKAGEYMAEYLNGKGKVAIINSPDVTSVQERVNGFKEVMKNHPDIEIIADVDGKAQKEPSMKAMEDTLQAHKIIDGVFAINDESALGALRAIEGAGKTDIIIVGYDATPEAQIEILKGGPLKADVVQYPKEMGKIAIETVIKYLNGEEVPEKVPVEVGILDKEALEKESVDTVNDSGGDNEEDTDESNKDKRNEAIKTVIEDEEMTN